VYVFSVTLEEKRKAKKCCETYIHIRIYLAVVVKKHSAYYVLNTVAITITLACHNTRQCKICDFPFNLSRSM